MRVARGFTPMMMLTGSRRVLFRIKGTGMLSGRTSDGLPNTRSKISCSVSANAGVITRQIATKHQTRRFAGISRHLFLCKTVSNFLLAVRCVSPKLEPLFGDRFLIVMHYCCASCSGSEWFNPPCYLTPWRVIKFRLHRHGIQLRRPWQYEAAFMSGENIFTVHADKLFRRENNGCRRVFRISRTGQS